MPLNRPFALSIGLAAGVIAAVGCYTAAAGAGASAHQTSRGQGGSVTEVATPTPSAAFAPCVAPAVLEDGVCVTHTVVTKVLPAPSRAAAATVQASTSSGTSEHRTSSAQNPAAGSEAGNGEDSDEVTESEGSPWAEDGSEDTNQHEDQDGEEAHEHADEPGGDWGEDPSDDAGESHSG